MTRSSLPTSTGQAKRVGTIQLPNTATSPFPPLWSTPRLECLSFTAPNAVRSMDVGNTLIVRGRRSIPCSSVDRSTPAYTTPSASLPIRPRPKQQVQPRPQMLGKANPRLDLIRRVFRKAFRPFDGLSPVTHYLFNFYKKRCNRNHGHKYRLSPFSQIR